MKRYKYYLINWILLLAFTSPFYSCSIEDHQDDPNNPSEGMPSLLLPRLIEQTFFDGSQVGPGATCQLLFYTERAESDQYWGWSNSSMSGFENIKQARLMEEAAIISDQPVYVAIANLFKQILFYQLTRDVGEIPYSDALKAMEGNFSPKYDTQKSIFQSILSELNNINNVLSENLNGVITGDILYNGDILKWQKLTNSYKLKILMDLSLKAQDSELNVINEFKKMFNNKNTYPLFENNQDMPRFKFYDLEGNRSPTFDRTTTKVKTKLTSTLVDYLKQTTDFRLFAYAEPAWPDDSDGWTTDQKKSFRSFFTSYIGLDPGGDFGDEVNKNSSNIHWRYYDYPAEEDYCKYTFAELNFIIAEAIVRGWVDADAETYFKRGVEASMSFYNVKSNDIEIYWQNTESKFVGVSDINGALEQINMQRWVAYFMNSNWEGYYNNRRTKIHQLGSKNDGVPHFKISPSHLVTKMPMRWMYPQSEYNTNFEHVTEAVNRQFGKNEDSKYDLIWMLVK